MTPRFLRDEAARFRGMAEEATREASKLRLLAMADDYEAQANAAGPEPEPVPEADEPESETTEPSTGEAPRIRSGRKLTLRRT